MTLAFSRYNVWVDVGDRSAVFNGLSGSLTAMSTLERSRVEHFVDGSDDGDGLDELIHDLAQRRVIVSATYDERTELRRRYDEGRWRSRSLGFTVVTSLGCNFDCPYCFEDKHPSLLKPAVADALIDILADSLGTADGLTVTWMGGEPLLGLRQLLDLSRRFIDVCEEHDAGYSASIITNGWYLDGDTARQLAAARVRTAQVTIDGPPDVHDRTRPHASGAPTFERILANVAAAADHLEVAIRVNVDRSNAHRAGELIGLLADAGLAGRVKVGLGRITDAVGNQSSPLATYRTPCLGAAEFGEFELAFDALAHRHGFGTPSLPRPVGTPCTAVRSREIVVGADGEMWKCWDDIGDPQQTIGTIFDWTVTDERLEPWLEYHPADDPQCSSCIAMPVCMGGCAHHHLHSEDPEARCGSFRHNHVGRITRVLEHHLGSGVADPAVLLAQVLAAAPTTGASSSPETTPVALGPIRRRTLLDSAAPTERQPITQPA